MTCEIMTTEMHPEILLDPNFRLCMREEITINVDLQFNKSTKTDYSWLFSPFMKTKSNLLDHYKMESGLPLQILKDYRQNEDSGGVLAPVNHQLHLCISLLLQAAGR